jgi:predicted ATP-dependent serine protease
VSSKEGNYPEVSNYQLVRVRQVADETQISTQTTEKAVDYDDLITGQKKSLKMKMNIFQIIKKQVKKVAQSIKIVDNVIKLSARQYISSSEIVSLIRQIIQILTSRYKKSEVKIVEQLHEQYYALKTASSVKAKIEE